jgi:hypothetical protein
MNLKTQLNDMLIESAPAIKELKVIVSKDKELMKLKKDKVDFLDALYNKYEKEVDAISKKYKLGMDELGDVLLSL